MLLLLQRLRPLLRRANALLSLGSLRERRGLGVQNNDIGARSRSTIFLRTHSGQNIGRQAREPAGSAAVKRSSSGSSSDDRSNPSAHMQLKTPDSPCWPPTEARKDS